MDKDKLEPFNFETGIYTKDGFQVKLSGVIKPNKSFEETMTKLLPITRDYVSNLSLIEALDLIKEENTTKLLELIHQSHPDLLHSFHITTIDATEADNIDLSLNHNLEGQSRKKGIFGKLKSIFKK